MTYPISEQLITYNRSGQALRPQGFVIHSTNTANATAQNEHDYFNSGDRQASAHYFADDTTIIRCIPENEVAWHAGSTANHKFLSVEICEFSDSARFQEVWIRTVWLVADACVRYGWSTGPNVYSHRGISALYGETNHTDPIQYLANHGKTWDQLTQAIDAMITTLKSSTSTTNDKGGNNVDVAVLGYTINDLGACMLVSQKFGNCAIYFRNSDKTFNADVLKAKTLYVIGGASVGHSNEKVLSGNAAKDTLQAVINIL